MPIDLDALIARTAPRKPAAKPRLDLDALIAKTAKRASAPRRPAVREVARQEAPPRLKPEDITEDMLVRAIDALTAKLGPSGGFRFDFVDPLFVRFWLEWDGTQLGIAEEERGRKHDRSITPKIRAALLRYAARETEIRLRAARQEKLPIPGLEELLPMVGPLSVAQQAARRGTGKLHSDSGAPGSYAKHNAVVEIGGKHYVFSGGRSLGPEQPYPEQMQEVVPAATWKGPTLTDAQMYRIWDLGIGRRGASYRGVKILVKGEPWVMTGKVLPVRPRPLAWDVFDREVYRDTKTGRYWFVVGHRAGSKGPRGTPDPACVWAVDAEAPDPAKAKPTCVDVEHFKREFYATHASGGPAYDAQAQRQFKALPQRVRRFGIKGELSGLQVAQAALARIPVAQRTNRYG